MKRRPRVLFMVLLLVAGAIVNVAVAWACALFITPGHDIRDFFNARPVIAGGDLWGNGDWQWWYVRVDSIPGAMSVTSSWLDPDIPAQLTGGFPTNRPEPLIPPWAEELRPSADASSRKKEHVRLADARGYPMLALYSLTSRDSFYSASSSPQASVSKGIVLGPTTAEYWGGRNTNRILPMMPIWQGFAINTLAYALLPGLVFSTCYALLWRRRRIKRGLCPKCAYDLRGTESKACPECGATR